MLQKNLKKFVLLSIVIGLIGTFFILDIGQYLSLAYIQEQQSQFALFYEAHRYQTLAVYALAYIAVTALSLPGAAVMTLLGGGLFGFVQALIVVSFASTIGATLAFLVARYLVGESLQKKYKHKLDAFNKGVEKEGLYYLFTLRLVPVFPFFMINLLMGLTKIKTVTYYWVSQLGMLPGTAAYVYAGTELAKIDSIKGILSPGLITAFIILGFLPLLSKRLVEFTRFRKKLWKYKKPKCFDYNMVVIGGGAAGLVTSYIAAAVNAKVALIEKNKMGGDCLNTGCVPSKAIIRSAKILNYIKRHKEFGIEEAEAKVNFKEIMARVHQVIKDIEPHDSVERYTDLGVNCISGTAKVIDPYRIEVNGKQLTTKNIVIATGARPFVPDIPGLNNVKYYTSDTIWNLKELPTRLLVLGGGPIGCELTQAFARIGSQVTQIEMMDRIMGREDEDVSVLVTENFKKDGIDVRVNHKALRFETNSDMQCLVCEHKGEEISIEFDAVLVAIGRRPNVNGFGLQELGVEISDRGTIQADEFLRTNYPNIYVCGDVAGPYQFTHTAAHQAWYAAVNALFSPLKKFKVDYRVIPWSSFTDPEVARVGLNERDAHEQGIPHEVTTYSIDDLDRAIADSENHGFIKVLTVPGKDKILGVTIVGHHAGDLIAEYVLAIKHGIGLNKILGTIHIYPTLAESNKYVAGNWKRAHAPTTILNWLEKFHNWRRS